MFFDLFVRAVPTSSSAIFINHVIVKHSLPNFKQGHGHANVHRLQRVRDHSHILYYVSQEEGDGGFELLRNFPPTNAENGV